MKTKDLVYLGVIGVLAYLLLRKKPASKDLESTTSTSSNDTPVGNSSNGGLNLGSNMDLPSLTPTPADGLSTEVALNSSNVNPLIKDDNEPTQIFGGVTLPPPYMSTSVVNPNPVDVIPASETSITSIPTASTTPTPTASTTVSGVMTTEPVGSVGTTPTPTATGESIVAEPIFPIRTIKAELMTIQPDMGNAIPIIQDVTDEMILECGDSFSIPNYDKESSYTNFWFDGKEYYTQTTSPLIKSLPVKISKQIFADACKKLQEIKMNNGKR
jgi:hypothetical protein